MCKIQYSETPLDIAATIVITGANAANTVQMAANTVTGINAFDLGAAGTPEQGQVSFYDLFLL